MFKNLLKISIRSILHDRVYSIINIIGLTLGISCSLFLTFYVLDELSYDQFHEKGDNVYRVVTTITEVDNEFTWSVAQTPFAPTVKNEYPEVTEFTRISGAGRLMFKKGGENIYEEELSYADSAFFELFSYKFIQGDPKTCLYEPNSIVLTKDLAIKYFDNTQVVGETLEGENTTYKITGVIENIPKNSHLNTLEGLISYNTLQGNRLTGNWGNFGVSTYIYTPELKDVAAFEEKLQRIYDDYCAEIFEQFGINFDYQLQNIKSIHLHSKIGSEAETNGDIAYVYIFTAVAFLILLIASINYMNLATARSMRRAREVGIRKVMGSMKGQLITQFLVESIVFTIVAVLISLVIVAALLPFFNDFLDKSVGLEMLLSPGILTILLGIILFVGMVSGTYPAFFLSSFKPIDVLKSNSSNKSGNPLLRKLLVIIQFGISVVMITGTWVVYDQLQFLREKDLGFEEDRIIRVSMFTGEMMEKVPVLRNELLKSPRVKEVGSATTSPGFGIGKNLINVENDKGEMVERGIDLYGVDYDYIPALNFTLLEGRNFSRDIPSDTTQAVIVTRSMANRMNWDVIVGKKFQFGTGEEDPFVQVVGVIDDYHHRSLYDAIEPILFYLRENNRIVHIKITGDDISESLAEVEQGWKNIFPNRPFDYDFLDQEFQAQYENDEQRGEIFSIFSVITIIITCLGLLGLASYTTGQRTKEIGIRKVNGASVGAILYMISKDFIILILISLVIAFPAAYFFMSGWLENFAYQTEISFLSFAMAALFALVITFMTISYHTLRAATANPVNALREE